MMINSIPLARAGPLPSCRAIRLQDRAAALFPERVDLLAGEAHQQTVLLLVLGDVLEDLRDGLGHGHPLDCSLATELFRHHPKKKHAKNQQTLLNAIDGLPSSCFRSIARLIIKQF